MAGVSTGDNDCETGCAVATSFMIVCLLVVAFAMSSPSYRIRPSNELSQ
jgi:hypothetical protein